jgi:hypothetical protein
VLSLALSVHHSILIDQTVPPYRLGSVDGSVDDGSANTALSVTMAGTYTRRQDRVRA